MYTFALSIRELQWYQEQNSEKESEFPKDGPGVVSLSA